MLWNCLRELIIRVLTHLPSSVGHPIVGEGLYDELVYLRESHLPLGAVTDSQSDEACITGTQSI